MPKIDELIAAAQEELNKAKDEDKPVLQAKLDALKSAKAAGVEMDNQEVNGLLTRKISDAEQKWQETIGMSREEAQKLFEELSDEALQDLIAGTEEGNDDRPVVERVQEALRSRDEKIEGLSTSLQDINRRYAKDKVDVAIREAFRSAGLDEKYLEPAKQLASYDDLIEKVTKGESVTTEEIGQKVEGVKNLSGVWFRSDEGGEGGDDNRTVAGRFKLKEEAVRPHIPATPDAREPAELTDEDRAKRATSVY